MAMHDSNGVDIISALVVNEINPLAKQRMDLVLELKVRPFCFLFSLITYSIISLGIFKFHASNRLPPDLILKIALLLNCNLLVQPLFVV